MKNQTLEVYETANYGNQKQEDRLCTYNVTLWRLRLTIVVIETQQYVSFLLLT
jgi:hypothetical protein